MAATLEQKPGPKGCCPCSKTNLFLHAVNLVFFVFGIVICGVAAWGVKHRKEFKEAVPPSAVSPLLVAGIFLIGLSVVGLLGAACNDKKTGRCLLLVYCFLLFLVMLLELVAAAAVLQAVGKLDSKVVGSLNEDSVDRWINETYIDCCFDASGNAIPPGDYSCWTARHSDVVNADTCASEPEFREALVDWMKSKLKPLAAVGLAFFVIQLVIVIGTCCSFCQGRRAAKHRRLEEDDDDDMQLLGVSSNGRATRWSGSAGAASAPGHGSGSGIPPSLAQTIAAEAGVADDDSDDSVI